jgi:protein required for attachment to host cells
MYRVCIALVDATRARLFTFERVAEGAGSRDELVERTDLVNPQRRRRASDDYRDQRVSQLDDKFARMAMAALRELIDEHSTQRVVICASPRMLGRLRSTAPGLLPDDIALDELPRDLVQLAAGDVRAELAAGALLPSAEPMVLGR